MPINTYTLLSLANELLEECSDGLGTENETLQMLIDEFFSQDARVVGTENEGKGNSYIGTIRDMFYEAAQQMDEFWRECHPESYEEM